MFDWVVMDVIHVGVVIPLIANVVFPIPSLPNASFSLTHPAGRASFPVGDRAGKPRLDESQAGWVIVIPVR